MQLRELDFKKCRYDLNAKTFVRNIERAIPQFANYEGKKKRQVFQYVVAMYDRYSPLWSKEPEYFPRKVLAVSLCGLSEYEGTFDKWSRQVMEGADEDVNKLVTAYLADTGHIEYTMLITELTMYHLLFQQQAGGKILNDKEYKTMRDLMANIQQRTRRIFGSGEDEELTAIKIKLYERAEQDRQKMNPEAIVKMLEKDGDFPSDWNPYGSKYTVDSLKFYVDDSEG